MSKVDSPALLDPALFWGWLWGIVLIFINAAKGKRKKGDCATGHGPLHAWHGLFSFFLCGFYEKRSRKGESGSQTGYGLPLYFLKNLPFLTCIFVIPSAGWGPALRKEFFVFGSGPQPALGITGEAMLYAATFAFTARNIGFTQRPQCPQRGYGLPINFLTILPFFINPTVIPSASWGPALKKEFFVFGSGPQPALGITGEAALNPATFAFSARNVGFTQRPQSAQRGYGLPVNFLKNLPFFINPTVIPKLHWGLKDTLLPSSPTRYKDSANTPAAPLWGGPFYFWRFSVAQNGLTPLMPHATAAWLVDNTALTFEQIAKFCGLHILEVQAIADDTASTKLTGRDPLRVGELTLAEIERGQNDPNYELRLIKAPEAPTRTKGARYTPVSKRQDKPDGIAWLLRNHPELSDGQIGKLIGTTRNTISAIKERSHWNIGEITPKDPVGLGLCSQRELDATVAKAAKLKGIQAVDDTRLEGDRAALIVELQAERAAAVRAAEDAFAAEAKASDDA
jgi:uncharacterized protein